MRSYDGKFAWQMYWELADGSFAHWDELVRQPETQKQLVDKEGFDIQRHSRSILQHAMRGYEALQYIDETQLSEDEARERRALIAFNKCIIDAFHAAKTDVELLEVNHLILKLTTFWKSRNRTGAGLPN